jgi:putative flippase GtrA
MTTFVRYVAIQLLAFIVDYGLFLIVLQSGLSGPIVANILARLAAGIFAFVAHRSFTFRVSEKSVIRRQAIHYFLLLALNVPITSVMLALLLLWIAEPVAAKFIADIICVPLIYGLSKHFIFTGQQKHPEKKNSTGVGV